jgi:tyrosine-protein phosphatase YwqE
MFGIFNKKKKENSGQELPLSFIQCDMHSHVLPGIDDGSPNIETSLQLIEGLVAQGYRKLICTPHIFKELYPNTPETISAAYQLLLPELEIKFPDLKTAFAAEYYMDDFFDLQLSKNEKFLTVHENLVLVEHSFLEPPRNLKEKLFNLQLAGYTPLLAHPERYEFYLKNPKAYDELYDIGCVFQLNLLSLTGYYGKVALELSKYLVKKKYIRLLGTDMHHQRHLESLNMLNGNKILAELISQDRLINQQLLY